MSAAVVLIAAGILPLAAADHEPLVAVSLGIVYAEDFEAGDGGWTAAVQPTVRPAPASSWAWGAPTSGPGAAASGSNVWATNLAGPYLSRDCGGLASPPITIPAGADASVSFLHWKHMEASTFSGSGFDGGIVFVTADGGETFTRVLPEGGYDAALLTTARACLDGQATGTTGFTGPAGTTPPPPTFDQVDVNLTSFAGQTVQVVLGFGADTSVHRDGWYVDDFTVTIDGNSTVEDFEADDGGFAIIATQAPIEWVGSWAHGTPTTGPGGASNLWATNLDGQFLDGECAWIESPAIDLSGLADEAMEEVGLAGFPATKATLRWQQWYRGSSLSTAGIVQVGTSDGYVTLEPEGGYPDTSISASITDCTGAIDGAFAGNLNVVGDPMTDMAADLSPFLGQAVTVRFLFTSGTFNQEGWYVDNVEVETQVYVGSPHLPTPPSICGFPGWTSGGTMNDEWCYGAATAGPTGALAYGTNLNGEPTRQQCNYLDSPAIPSALFDANPTLTFDHWHNLYLVGTTSAFDAAILLVSNDDGATWALVSHESQTGTSSATPSNCFADMLGLPSGGKQAWAGDNPSNPDFDGVTVDLSDFVGGTAVKVRFAFGGTSFGPSSSEPQGWFINNVNLGGQQVLP